MRFNCKYTIYFHIYFTTNKLKCKKKKKNVRKKVDESAFFLYVDQLCFLVSLLFVFINMTYKRVFVFMHVYFKYFIFAIVFSRNKPKQATNIKGKWVEKGLGTTLTNNKKQLQQLFSRAFVVNSDEQSL